MKKIIPVTILTLSIILVGGQFQQAFALPYQAGDVFVSVGSGLVEQWRDIAGVMTFIQTIDCSGFFGNVFTTGSTFDVNGEFYVTMFNGLGVCHVDNNGVALGTFGTYLAGDQPESILFNVAGDAFIGTVDGSTEDLYQKNSVGTAITQFNTQVSVRGTDWIDLTAGQQVMYHTSEGREIFRHDILVPGNNPLADFAGLPGQGLAFALRILPNGNVLVADAGNVKLLDNGGNVIGTYDKTGFSRWFALNVDPNGNTFWSADSVNSNVCQFNINAGQGLDNELRCFTPNNVGAVFGLSVFGEQTVGGPSMEPIGGEILPISTTSLLLAGMSNSAMWLIPLVAIGGGAFALLRFQVLKGKN